MYATPLPALLAANPNVAVANDSWLDMFIFILASIEAYIEHTFDVNQR